MSDIYSVLDKNSILMLHKMKRKSKFYDKRYLKKVERLSEKTNYIRVDPNIDALLIVQKTKACISIPFTSTALIAKHEGKPSIYYDPSGKTQKDDRAAHGIQVINNLYELEEWVKTSIVNK